MLYAETLTDLGSHFPLAQLLFPLGGLDHTDLFRESSDNLAGCKTSKIDGIDPHKLELLIESQYSSSSNSLDETTREAEVTSVLDSEVAIVRY